MDASFISFTHLRAKKNPQLPASPKFVKSSHLLHVWLLDTMLHLAFTYKSLPSFTIHPRRQQTLPLASFVPLSFIPCFIFTSWLPPSFTLIPFNTRCSSSLLFSYMERHYTESCWEAPTKIQTPKWNQAELPSRVRVPLPRQTVHGHTAAVRLTDFWHRAAARRTQNPSQGADACFLLTYAPEMEQGGWEVEGKAGNIRGGREGGS